METPTTQKSFPWPLAAGACVLVVMFTCGLMSLFGAGGALLFSRILAKERAASHEISRSLTPQQAQLQNLRGFVTIEDDEGSWIPVEEGEFVTAGQRIRTGDLSSVTLAFYDGSRATLLANAELSVDELDAPKGKERSIVLTQWAGESDHDVVTNKIKGSRYEVNTPDEVSAEAKGTIFHVTVTPAQVAYYYVREGTVAVSSQQVTVLVNTGYVTTILLGQPPLIPVLSVTGEGLVTQTGEVWVIDGKEYKVDQNTSFSGTPQVGDWAIVKGRLLKDGSRMADWVILAHTSPANRFNLTGTVEATGEAQWTINGQAIDISAATTIDTGIVVGDVVRVEGLVQSGGALEAAQIEKLDHELGEPFKFTGILEAMEDEQWVISGIGVSLNEDTLLAEGLETGILVRVTGWVTEGGEWLAGSVQMAAEDEGRFAFTGELESMEPWKVAGIAFETRDWTEVAEDLETGILVRVEGQIDANGLWIASKVERLDAQHATLVLVGTVLSLDPWIVSGYPLVIGDETVIDGEIAVGMLVRVEVLLLPDGSWQILRIIPLDAVTWFPGCMEVVATVISVNGSQLVLQDWPTLTMAEGAQVEGELIPNSRIRFQICFNADMTIQVVYIVIIEPGVIVVPVEPPADDGGKVTVCHKPGKKKGGHSITISRSALPAHLGHGDYEGPCR